MQLEPYQITRLNQTIILNEHEMLQIYSQVEEYLNKIQIEDWVDELLSSTHKLTFPEYIIPKSEINDIIEEEIYKLALNVIIEKTLINLNHYDYDTLENAFNSALCDCPYIKRKEDINEI